MKKEIENVLKTKQLLVRQIHHGLVPEAKKLYLALSLFRKNINEIDAEAAPWAKELLDMVCEYEMKNHFNYTPVEYEALQLQGPVSNAIFFLSEQGVYFRQNAGFGVSTDEVMAYYEKFNKIIDKIPLMITKYSLAIKKDEENKQLLAYDLKDNEIQEHTEGILKEVNQKIADLIQLRFDVKLCDYNVAVCLEQRDINALKLS